MIFKDNKELNDYLEALERLAMPDELHIEECKKLGIGLTEDYDILKQYFEAIDNANHSEALKDLEIIRDYSHNLSMVGYLNINYALDTIKQALIKTQKQEKVLSIIKEKNVDIALLKKCETVEEYNFCINFSEDNLTISYEHPLTQDEFDLLKGWIN